MAIFFNKTEDAIKALIDVALAEEGYLEKASNSQLDSKTANAGYNNYTKYGRDMHNLEPTIMDFPAYWCDAFVDWCFYKTFGDENARNLLCGGFNDYTVASAQLFKNRNRWITSNPIKGDVVFFKNSTRICHTGIVYKVDSTRIYTVEGNTSGGSTVVANGGAVRCKTYLKTNTSIAGYGRPDYSLAVQKSDSSTMPAKPTYKEGWMKAADGVRWWYQFSDGSYAKDDGKNNGWYLLNRKWFMFDKEGYMLTGFQTRVNKTNGKNETFYLRETKDSNEGACMKTDERGAFYVWEV